jgi:hypothetical protein
MNGCDKGGQSKLATQLAMMDWQEKDQPTDLRDHKCNRPNVVGKDEDYCS